MRPLRTHMGISLIVVTVSVTTAVSWRSNAMEAIASGYFTPKESIGRSHLREHPHFQYIQTNKYKLNITHYKHCAQKWNNNYQYSDYFKSIIPVFFGLYSTDKTLIEFSSLDTTYSIPRNYLETVILDRADNSVTFSAVAKIPFYFGVINDANDKRGIFIDEKLKDPTHDLSIVRITLENSDFDPVHDPNAIVFNAEAKAPDTEWQFGLSHSETRSLVGESVYFKRPADNFSGFVAFCQYEPLYTCLSYLRVSPKTSIIYQYSTEKLSQWMEISRNVERLVDSWIIKRGG